MKDTFTVLSVMAEWNTFSPDATGLRNIMNGVTAGSAVNVDTTKAIGENTIVSGWTVCCKLHIQRQCTGCHSLFEIGSQD